MSTILNALKQAEKRNPIKGKDTRPSFNIRTRLSFQAKQKKKNLFLKPVPIVSIVLLIIVMSIFANSILPVNKTAKRQVPFADKQPHILSSKPDTVRNKHQIPVEPVPESSTLPETSNPIHPEPEGNFAGLSISQNKPDLKSEFTNKRPVKDVYFNTTNKKTARSSGTSMSKKTKERAPFKTPDKPKKTPGEKPSFNTEETSHPSMEIDDPVKNSKKPLTPDTPNRQITILKNNELKIQAISWAQKPENRIAVIDNRVLRQGDAVQGYRLVEIEKDSVILQDSDKDYRLEFNYR